jgi:hypothetical protein
VNQRVKVIAIAVLLLAAGFLFWWNLRPSEEDLIYQENIRKAAEAAQQQGGAPLPTAASAAAARPAQAPGAAPPAPVQSQFVTADVDPDELIAKIKEVDYDYEFEQRLYPRDPMTPLVGPMALPSISAASETGEAPLPTARETQALVQSMRLTGIVWDSRRPVAVINTEIVAPGDELVRGIAVESVEADHVLLRTSTGNLIPIELEER